MHRKWHLAILISWEFAIQILIWNCYKKWWFIKSKVVLLKLIFLNHCHWNINVQYTHLLWFIKNHIIFNWKQNTRSAPKFPYNIWVWFSLKNYSTFNNFSTIGQNSKHYETNLVHSYSSRVFPMCTKRLTMVCEISKCDKTNKLPFLCVLT